jgi:hypothetical protein
MRIDRGAAKRRGSAVEPEKRMSLQAVRVRL